MTIRRLVWILLFIPSMLAAQGTVLKIRTLYADTIHSQNGNPTSASIYVKDTLRLTVLLDSAYYKFTKFHTQPIYTILGLQDSLNTRFRRGDTSWLHATSSATGFLSNIDWTTFNNKQNALSFPLDTSLTQAKVKKLIAGFGISLSPTSGIGDVTVTSDTSGSGGVPATRTLTIAANSPLSSSAGAQDLSANRTWTLSADTSTAITGLTTLYQNSLKSTIAQGLQWDGGATNLVAATGRTSLGLGTMAMGDSTLWLNKIALKLNITDTAGMGTYRDNLLALKIPWTDTTSGGARRWQLPAYATIASLGNMAYVADSNRAAWTDEANTFTQIQTLMGGASVGDTNKAGQGIFISAHFRDSVINSRPDERLYISVSNDGINWNLLSARNLYTSYDGVLRDPALLYYNNSYFIAFTKKYNPGPSHSIGLLSSKDLVKWDSLTTITVSAGANDVIWMGDWFVDTDGSVNLIYSKGWSPTNYSAFAGNHQPYCITATNATLTSWSAPTQITGSGLPNSLYDLQMVKTGATYRLWYHDSTTNAIQYLSSSSKTSGYTVTTSGDWAGWGTYLESPKLVQIDSTRWRIYLDKHDVDTAYYSESTDNFATWTAKLPATTSCLNIKHMNPRRYLNVTVARNAWSSIDVNGATWESNGAGSATLNSVLLGGIDSAVVLALNQGMHIGRGLAVGGNASIGGTLTTTGAINGNTTLGTGTSPTFAGLNIDSPNPAYSERLTFRQNGTTRWDIISGDGTNNGRLNIGRYDASGNYVTQTLYFDPSNGAATLEAGLTLNGALSMGTNSISSVGAITSSGNISTIGDDNVLAWKNTAENRALYITSVHGWVGSGSTEDVAIGSIKQIKFYTNNLSTPTLTLDNSTNATFAGTIQSGAITSSGLSTFDANAGTAAIGTGDSVRVTVTGLTIATGVPVVSYKTTSATPADTVASWDINAANTLTLRGKFGWTIGWAVIKK